MNDTYTAAQFVRGIREAAEDERARILAFLNKKLISCKVSATRTSATELLAGIIEDIKEGEHERNV